MIQAHVEAPVEPAFSHFFPFKFDPFQLEAMAHIRADRSVMVAAPTSSGKTLVAEYGLWRALQAGSRAIYTTPIKALSNQKRRDLEVLFPGKVGLVTGDRSENPDAPIVVMTTEVLRNMLVEDADALHWVTCVVFDEVHYLADQDRGTVWEEAIITCPPHVQLVCLSATIANADEIARWISATHREIALVRHDERPVPLEHFYFTGGKLHLVRDEWGDRRESFPREGRLPAPHPADVLRAMDRLNLLPAIWFAFSRAAAEWSAEACVKSAPRPTPDQQERIEAQITWTMDILPPEDRNLPQLSRLIQLLRQGVGFHHAGLLPPLKELVERLFGDGLMSVVCATDTLAVGINMPARTVVISSMSRPFGGLLTPNDFSQLTGRAGRRGIDERGGVVMLPAKFYAFEEAYSAVSGPLLPVMSAFRLRYSTLLSIMEGREERLENLVQSSLRQYQMKAKARQAAAQAAEIRLRLQLDDNSEEQTALYDYLALQAELSAAEKEQKRARNARAKAKTSQSTRRYDRAREERERLLRLVRSHPAHGTAIVTERQDPERLVQLRRLNTLEGIIRQAESESDREALETAAAVRAVLLRLGYIGKRGLARKARGLREIVAPSGIVLSELYETGAMGRLTPEELAEAVSWFASDTRRRRDNYYRLPRNLAQLRRQSMDIYNKIAAMEATEGIELVQGPSAWFYGAAYAWCRGDSVEDITETIELGEGDVVSVLNKTVDLLDQLENMLIQYDDRALIATSSEARRLLVRGLVAMVRSGDRFLQPAPLLSESAG